MFHFAGTVLNNTRLEQVCYILKSQAFNKAVEFVQHTFEVVLISWYWNTGMYMYIQLS